MISPGMDNPAPGPMVAVAIFLIPMIMMSRRQLQRFLD